MEWTTIIFASLLVVLSLGFLAWHWVAWRKADHGGLSQRDQQFARRQFHRRTQASGMLGAIGLTMLASQWIEDPRVSLCLWLAILCAVLWLGVMAMLDWWSTRTFYGRDEIVNTVEMELLKKEIRKYQEEHGETQP